MDKNIFGGGGERRMRGVGSSKKQGQKANGLGKRAMYPPLGWQVESTYKKHWYWRIIFFGFLLINVVIKKMHEAMELQWKWKVGVTLPLAKLFYGVEPKALVKKVNRG